MIDTTRWLKWYLEKMAGFPLYVSLGIPVIVLLVIAFLLYKTYLQEDKFEERTKEDEK